MSRLATHSAPSPAYDLKYGSSSVSEPTSPERTATFSVPWAVSANFGR